MATIDQANSRNLARERYLSAPVKADAAITFDAIRTTDTRS